MSQNQIVKRSYQEYLSNLSVFFGIQILLTVILIIVVNVLTYPLNMEEDMQIIAVISLIIFIIKSIYTFYIGRYWGKYKLYDVIYSVFRPFFYYVTFILFLSIVLQVVFPSITGILFWPFSNFLFIEIDGYFLYIYYISAVFTNSSGGDAIILFYLMLAVLGMMIIPFVTIVLFLIGFMHYRFFSNEKYNLDLPKLDEFKELKYLLLSLAILGTCFLFIVDFSHSTFMNGQVTLPESISFAIFELIGLAFLVFVYYYKKRDFRKIRY